MNSNTGYTKWESKAGAALLLCFLLLAPDASAFSFFGRKKEATPVENIPPATQFSPGVDPTAEPADSQNEPARNPQQDSAQDQAAQEQREQEQNQTQNAEQPTVKDNGQAPVDPAAPENADAGQRATPAQRAANRSQEPADPLPVLVEKGIFPADSGTRTTPITRAELASILVKALEHNTTMVSEFPFFRDVPREHWAYVPVEVAREKRLLTDAYDHGFYYPDRAVTFGDVYRAISKAITGPPPSSDEAAHLLSRFVDLDELEPDDRMAMAKMARTRYFWRNNQGDISSHWTEPVSPKDLAPLVASLMYLTEHKAALIPERGTLPVLPPDISLTVTPSSAIFEERIGVGEVVFFTLVYPADPLPKGTRLRGIVRDVLPSKTYIIELTGARTPEDQIYRTSAELSIIFPPREKTAFIVPGEVFQTTTMVPEGVTQNAMPASPSQSPAEQAGSSTRMAVPPLTPPTK